MKTISEWLTHELTKAGISTIEQVTPSTLRDYLELLDRDGLTNAHF